MSADVISEMTRELSKLKILSIEQVVQPFPAPPILNIFCENYMDWSLS